MRREGPLFFAAALTILAIAMWKMESKASNRDGVDADDALHGDLRERAGVEPMLRARERPVVVPQASSERAPSPDSTVDEPRRSDWTLTFESIGADGEPQRWLRYALLDRTGDAKSSHHPGDDEPTSATIEMVGDAYLAVYPYRGPPYISPWLKPPSSGKAHIKVVFKGLQNIGGTAYLPDGKTPLSRGGVSFHGFAGSPKRKLLHYQGHGMVGKDGRFELTGVPNGLVKIKVRPWPVTLGDPGVAEARAGDRNARVVLRPVAYVALQVVDAVTNRAPKTTQLVIDTMDVDGLHPHVSQVYNVPFDSKDPYQSSWIRVKPGEALRYRVRAHKYASSGLQIVETSAQGGTQVVRVPLSRDQTNSGRVTFRVEAASGLLPKFIGVARITDATARRGEFSSRSGTPHVDGVISLDLMPNTYHFRIDGASSPDPRKPETFVVPSHFRFTLDPGGQRELSVSLNRGGFVVVTGWANKSLRHVTLRSGSITLRRRARRGTWGKAQDNVRFLGVVPPGTWAFVDAKGDEVSTEFFVVREREVTVVPFRQIHEATDQGD